uniref:Uncharacterized protein n=1 Tax=Eiseniibacteriota bacterium TaxID=2212470 RepID=A0A832I3E4_UNCEI
MSASRARRGPWARVEPALVALVALHSAALGVAAMAAPEAGLRLSGFGEASPLFFPRQVGVFHVVVAAAYAIEYVRYRGVTILLVAKAIAVAFLGAALLAGPQPWVVPFSAAADAAMGLAVAFVRARARAEARAR